MPQKWCSKLPFSRVTLKCILNWEIGFFGKYVDIWELEIFLTKLDLVLSHSSKLSIHKKNNTKIQKFFIPSNNSSANMNFSPFLTGLGRLVIIWSTDEDVFTSTLFRKIKTSLKLECLRR